MSYPKQNMTCAVMYRLFYIIHSSEGLLYPPLTMLDDHFKQNEEDYKEDTIESSLALINESFDYIASQSPMYITKGEKKVMYKWILFIKCLAYANQGYLTPSQLLHLDRSHYVSFTANIMDYELQYGFNINQVLQLPLPQMGERYVLTSEQNAICHIVS